MATLTQHPQVKAIVAGLNDIPDNWALTPVSEKNPYRNGWQKETPLSKDQIKKEIKKGNATGYGLRLGDVSGGLIAIDVDGASVEQLLNAIAPHDDSVTVCWTSNKPGRYQMLFQIPDEYREQLSGFTRQDIKTWNGYHCEEGEHLELRYNGHQSVLPCSYHPETGRYEWLMSPNDSPIAIAPDWIIKLALGELTDPANQPATPQNSNPPKRGNKNRWECYLDDFQFRSEPIPLINCLSRENRELAESGIGEGARDNTAIRIALDAVGCENWLSKHRQAYEGSAEEIIKEFGSRCSPPLKEKDIERILKSARKSSQGSAIANKLGDDALKAVVASHFWEYEKPSYKHSQARSHPNQELEQEEKSKAEQIRELINNYINATDTIEQVSIKSEIQSRFKISKEDFTQLVDEAKGLTFNKPIEPEVLIGKDLFSGNNPGIKWLVPGLLPIGGVTILGANSGQGKTTLAYDCAGAVNFAEEFLGEKPTKQGKVLILSSDEPKQFAIDKLANRGFSDSDDIIFVPGWTTDNWQLFEQLMSQHNPDLVIIDSFNSIHSDENFDANSDRAAITINQLNPVLEQYDAACLLIHHLSKSKENKGVNKLRNSTAIAAASSMIWSLEGENKVKTFQLEKTRGTEPLSLKVEMDAPNGKFNIVEGAVWDDETKSLGERIVQLFESFEPNTRLEFQEIKSYITGNEHSLRKALERLTKLGTLSKGKSSVNKRKSVWFLPSHGKAPPSPCSDRECPNEAKTTTSGESQTLDNDSTLFRQHSTELDSLNSPKSESPSESEKQTLDRQVGQEGGECREKDVDNDKTKWTNPEQKPKPTLEQQQEIAKEYLKQHGESKQMVIATETGLPSATMQQILEPIAECTRRSGWERYWKLPES